MKIIAYYLPQFHNIPENDQWWGSGFTEWVSVRNSYPVFDGHDQPRIPLNNYYYDLLDDNVKKWQIDLAKAYGIYGFCYYHYWFNGKLLLEKPLEQVLRNPDLDFPFCVCWANEPWTKRWVGNRKETLIAQKYGGKEEWTEHFYYLLPFFRDERYIRINGKPFISLWQPENVPCLQEMIKLWKDLAVKEGLGGLYYAYKVSTPENASGVDNPLYDACIEHQPQLARTMLNDAGLIGKLKTIRRIGMSAFERCTGRRLGGSVVDHIKRASGLNKQDYSKIWNKILMTKPVSDKSIPGAFTNWDNSPRYHEKAEIYLGGTPELFEQYLSRQIARAKEIYRSEYMMLFAWNEWAEGAYLEPDESTGYGYLEAVREALKKNKEWPVD